MNKSDNNKNSLSTTIPCAVYEDLLPLVQDGLASVESKILVEEHEKTCPNCGSNKIISTQMNESRILQKIKLQIMYLAFIPLIIGIFFGVNFGITQYMFNNIWLMPLLGGISVLIYRKKSLWLLLVVFVASSTYHGLPMHYDQPYHILNIAEAIQWGNIYAGLFLLGQVIVSLFAFALKKEED